MAWTLRHLRPSLVPGGDESDLNPFLYRYATVSLYTYVEVEGKRWYQIGKDQWVHQFDVAKITPIERPEALTRTNGSASTCTNKRSSLTRMKSRSSPRWYPPA
jgi:hypothetical protein